MTTSSQHSHLARAPYKEPPAHAPNAALLIDFDNVTMGIRSDLQSELKRLLLSDIIRGKVAVQRAYADWRRYPQYIVPLAESSIDLIYAPAYGSSKKNATDIRLAIDALELVFTRPEIGTFILLSGDSDFSSLVLKLKEYGKYVIGVGIRESSSDLLIQNCDEYFSYNELAGLTKESDVEHVRRDPWELVVEAVKQMTAHNDVMRSDRLKQVMQEIDPGFDEKDAGFSRFSKFVQEAAHRGLIATERLDNGQFEISLGAKVEEAAPVAQPVAAPASTAAPAPPAAPARAKKGSIVSDAFGLLRQALGKISGDQTVSAEAVREAMNDLAPEGTKRVDARSMPKLLRQAHDAELIDLSRDDEGAYEVRVRLEDSADAAPTPAPEPVRETRAAHEEEEEYEPPQPASSAPPPPYSQQSAESRGMPMRSARFRRGSRGPKPAAPDVPRVGVVEVDPNFRSRVERMPPRSGPSAPAASEPPSTGSGRSDEDRPRRERGGRGRGGRGRGRGGNREGREGNGGHGHGGYEGREGREGRSGGDSERSRGRRGGRGRGGCGGGRSDRNGEDRPRGANAYNGTHESERSASPPPPPPSPPPAPRPAAPAESREEGDSFWSRVKRGLIGP
ncbi:MAG TPA: NYN domain-containing protein [Gemmatimonadales bacterium]|nr:NYN domain-containing protein [Gemmatimonadales bacterium]